jgi:hypothetical protein
MKDASMDGRLLPIAGCSGDLGYAEVLQQVGVEGGAEVADAVDVDPHAAARKVVLWCAEEDEVAGHDDEDGPVDRAARRGARL